MAKKYNKKEEKKYIYKGLGLEYHLLVEEPSKTIKSFSLFLKDDNLKGQTKGKYNQFKEFVENLNGVLSEIDELISKGYKFKN